MRNDTIIIKRVKKVAAHAHHGGAWKVAYADFVTAMMAFFLLLWLLNVTTDEQKNGIAEYFAPATVSRSMSGAGGILGGRTLVIEGSRISQDGVPAVIDDIAPPDPRRVPEANAQQEVARDPTDEELAAKQAEREQEAFEQAEAALRQAIKDNPQLAELSRHLIVDNTPEGLRIQLVDQEQQSMFPTGSAVMNDRARQLTQAVAQAVLKLPNKLSISGHTDAQPYRTENGYGNWELSTDRANASRRALIEAGVPADRFRQVTGNADQDPLIASEPLNPSNRRISIVLLREAPVVKKAEHQP